MSDLIPVTSELDSLSDPGARIVLSCERAKAWIDEAVHDADPARIVEIKAQAEALRVFAVQKQLGKDVGLAAATLVRRAERGIGLAIRRGQAEGKIVGAGDVSRHLPLDPAMRRIKDFGIDSDNGELTRGPYAMADGVTEEQFEKALVEARAEGNLTRSNVVRKLKPELARPSRKKAGVKARTTGSELAKKIGALAEQMLSSAQIATELGLGRSQIKRVARERGVDLPADRALGRRIEKQIDTDRVLRLFIDELGALMRTVRLMDLDTAPAELVSEALEVIDEARRGLGSLRRRLVKAGESK